MTLEDRKTYEEYCRVLEISPSATEAEIRSAHKKLCLKYHPDLHSESEFADLFTEKMQELNAAKDHLLKHHAEYAASSSSGTPYGGRGFSDTSDRRGTRGRTYGGFDGSDGSTEFDRFCEKNKGYLIKRVKLLNVLRELYSANRKGKLKTYLHNHPDLSDTVHACAYGILMRQALEYILKHMTSTQEEDPESVSGDGILERLKRTDHIDPRELEIYYKVKDLSNKAAHLSCFHSKLPSSIYENVYNSGFRTIIIGFIKSNKRASNLKYLKKILRSLEKMTLKDKVCSTLLTGLFIRFILECISSIICFNQKTMGFDSQFSDSEISLHEKIKRIREKTDQFGKRSVHAEATANNLDMLRITSNFSMHYSEYQPNLKHLEEWYGLTIRMRHLYCSELSRIFDACREVLEEEYRLCSGTENPKKHHDYSKGGAVVEDPLKKAHRLNAHKRLTFPRIVCWILFFPIMLASAIAKSNMEFGGKVMMFIIVWPLLSALWVFLLILLLNGVFAYINSRIQTVPAGGVLWNILKNTKNAAAC